jgi:lipopolysaccharide export system permease protein
MLYKRSTKRKLRSAGVNRFDRYMLSQFMALFGFFALVLVSVYWVNRAVVLFDRLIGDGQSVFVFFEITAMTLPNVIKLVLPIAIFAAACYGTSRKMADSELTVMQATGFSPWRLARPVATFGLFIGLMMAVLSNYLVPLSLDRLDIREREIAENATARLLTEGVFMHPNENVTFYISEITNDGVLENLFIYDQSAVDQTLIYSADEAYLLRDENGPKLIMGVGQAQVLTEDGLRLFTTNFGDFTYDISEFLNYRSNSLRALERTPTLELWQEPRKLAAILAWQNRETDPTMNGMGWVQAERHGRIAAVTMCIVSALVGFATLLLGGFSRFGVWPQTIAAFILLVILEAMKNAVINTVRLDPALWPTVYLPTLIGGVLVALMLASRAYPVPFLRRSAS